MASKKIKRTQVKVVHQFSKNFKKKIFFFMTVINSLVWFLSYQGVGYDLVRSVAGDSKFSDFTLAIYYSPIFFDPRLINTQPPFDYAMTPPLAALFRLIDLEDWMAYLVSLNLISLICFIYVLNKMIKLDKYIFIVILNSFPIVFCILRGSADLWLLTLMTFTFYLYNVGKSFQSAILLGLLIACKPHFAAFGLIYLVKRDWRNICVLAASTISFFLAPLFWLNSHGIFDQLKVLARISANYQRTYSIGDGGLMWDNGIIGLLKVVFYSLAQPNNLQALDFGLFATRIQPVIAIILVILVVKKYVKFTPSVEELWLASSILFILMSPVSASYRLVFFVPALIFYLYKSTDRFILISLTFLLLPKSFIWVKTSNGHEFVGDSLINPMILIVLCLYLFIFKTNSNSIQKINKM